jgi:hypothetical protein
MESLYEFKGERSEKIIKAASLNHFFKRPHLYIFVAAFLTVLFYISFSRIDFNFDDLLKLSASILGACISFLFFAAIIFVTLFLAIKRTIKLTIARDRESAQGQAVICHTVFYEDRIELCVDRAGKFSEASFEYSQIKRISKNKESVFIYTKAQQFMAVENSTILKGDITTFYSFLKEKQKASKK